MLKKFRLTSTMLILLIFILSACNLPSRQVSQTQPASLPSIVTTAPSPTPTPVSLCSNEYFPSSNGSTWQYSGTNSAIGAYERTDTISALGSENFTVQTTEANITFTSSYSCSADGLTSANPVEQYAGALLSSSNAPVTVTLTSNEGITIPARLSPGDTWQQTAGFDATSKEINVSGTFVFNYSAIGYEQVTVPLGTFNALRVDTTVRIEVTALRILAGTYSISTWLAPQVGIVKSEGASHVTGIEFTDNMQLSSFSATQ